MGLDMYFFARKSDSYYDIDKVNYPEDLKEYQEIGHYEIHYDLYEIGYFRKFNALHSYIVEMFADGVDQCQEIYLSKENIQDTLDTMVAVQNDHSLAETCFPTAEGFFFGSIEYDDWYFDDLDAAIDLFTHWLKTLDFNKYDVIYQASW